MSNLKYSIPVFKEGFQPVVKPGDSGLKYIHFGLLNLKGGEEWSAVADGKEAVFLLQEGGGRIRVEESSGGEMDFELIPGEAFLMRNPAWSISPGYQV